MWRYEPIRCSAQEAHKSLAYGQFTRLLDRNPKVYREEKLLFKYRKHIGSRDYTAKRRWMEIKKLIENKDKAIFDKWNANANTDIRANNLQSRYKWRVAIKESGGF